MDQDTKNEFGKVHAKFEKIDAEFGKVHAKFDKVDAKFEKIDAEFEKIDAEFDKIDAEFGKVKNEIRKCVTRTEFEELIRWIKENLTTKKQLEQYGELMEEVIEEIKASRYEREVAYYRYEILDNRTLDHEKRITRLEQKQQK